MTTMLAAPKLDTLRPQERVSLAGAILAAETVRAGVSPVYRCVIVSARTEIDLLFLGHATIAGLAVGTCCTAAGTLTAHHGRLAIWNPRYRIQP
jgi:hypothetical protein